MNRMQTLSRRSFCRGVPAIEMDGQIHLHVSFGTRFYKRQTVIRYMKTIYNPIRAKIGKI